jgi:hypothetical protein
MLWLKAVRILCRLRLAESLVAGPAALHVVGSQIPAPNIAYLFDHCLADSLPVSQSLPDFLYLCITHVDPFPHFPFLACVLPFPPPPSPSSFLNLGLDMRCGWNGSAEDFTLYTRASIIHSAPLFASICPEICLCTCILTGPLCEETGISNRERTCSDGWLSYPTASLCAGTAVNSAWGAPHFEGACISLCLSLSDSSTASLLCMFIQEPYLVPDGELFLVAQCDDALPTC